MRPTLRGRTGHPPVRREKNKPSPHSRYTWSYCPQGLSEPSQLPAKLVSSYLTFSPSPQFAPWLSKSLKHYLSSCSHPHEAPAFHGVRRPVQPGLSSPSEKEAIERRLFFRRKGKTSNKPFIASYVLRREEF